MNKVLMVSDMEDGGAGTIAKLLHKYIPSDYWFYQQMYKPSEMMFNSVYRDKLGLEFPKRDYFTLTKAVRKYPLLHLHNLHGMKWNIRLIEKWSKTIPIVWTLHDMWSITGKCPYPYDCTNYITKTCARDNCKYLTHYPYYAHLHSSLMEKRKVINKLKNVVMICPSRWLYDQVSDIYKDADIRIIHNGVDLSLFNKKTPIIASTKPTVLAIPSSGSDAHRKGTDILQVVHDETCDAFNWITFGSGRVAGAYNFGWVPRETQPYLYSSADIYVHAARMDNWPSTILEALACDCKCIALNSGGVSEMIYNIGFTTDDLIELMHYHKSSNQKCEYLDAQIMAKQYSALYAELMRR